MTKSTITREQLLEIIETDHVQCGEASYLARMALAAMDSEPVAEVVSIYGDPEAFGEREIRPLVGIQQMPYGTKLYRHAQPASERDQVRQEHAEWSQATFGNVGPVGPLKHLSKEALEAAAEPDDLSEWADMQFLLWDAQRRAGITDEQITQAMIEKLAVNKLREWPAPKDGEPRLHIKEQAAPVVPEDNDELVRLAEKFGAEVAWANEPNEFHHLIEFTPPQFRAAMLHAQSGDDGESTDDERIMTIEGILNCKRCGDEGWIVGEMGITRCACNQGNPVFKIDLNSDFIKHVKAVSEKVRAGNSPVIGIDPASGPDCSVEVRYVAPPGYVMVPKDLLSELRDLAHPEIEKYCEMWEGRRDSEFPALRKVITDADALLAAAPQEVKGE